MKYPLEAERTFIANQIQVNDADGDIVFAILETVKGQAEEIVEMLNTIGPNWSGKMGPE